MSEEKCIFCEIVAGAIPASVVYDDETALGFMDITPVNKGHVLLVPKAHSRNLFDAEDGALSALLPIAKKIARALQRSIGVEGVNIHINNEPAAGQVVFHTHLHIIPRFREDGLHLWRGRPYQNGEMEKAADQIKTALHE